MAGGEKVTDFRTMTWATSWGVSWLACLFWAPLCLRGASARGPRGPRRGSSRRLAGVGCFDTKAPAKGVQGGSKNNRVLCPHPVEGSSPYDTWQLAKSRVGYEE
eukprot:2642790-Alexandrium_andersonii.AAC.1